MADDALLADYAEHIRNACRLLPAWFVPRMMDDCWSFALLLTTGHTVHITHITDVRMTADGLWLDVELADRMPLQANPATDRDILAPTSRTSASIYARHVVMAYETADT
jgi:hypothetical protein